MSNAEAQVLGWLPSIVKQNSSWANKTETERLRCCKFEANLSQIAACTAVFQGRIRVMLYYSTVQYSTVQYSTGTLN